MVGWVGDKRVAGYEPCGWFGYVKRMSWWLTIGECVHLGEKEMDLNY